MKKTDILTEALELREALIAHRRALHQRPETGFELKNTLAYVRGQLEEMGYSPKICGRAGLTATVGSGSSVFLLRADMDALPIREEAGIPFAAKNGNMHACGHDMHTAMLLGAARLLKAHEAELKGTVKFMFQGAEELLEGAKDMLESGLLEEPRPDAGMMIHVMTGSDLPSGTVTVCDGGVSAPGAAYFTINVQGRGCHGAMPNMGIDPITASAHILLGLQGIRAGELGFTEEAVLTVGTFRAGNRPNIIPDTAMLQGSLRAFGNDTMAFMRRRTEEIAAGTAAAHRATAEVVWDTV
ncbi:MAG: amidohydrolase, partial [Clostridia bacterium]|nr:amidohydrolase [Clostridia bacterium]